jgi:hypothetical protein
LKVLVGNVQIAVAQIIADRELRLAHIPTHCGDDAGGHGRTSKKGDVCTVPPCWSLKRNAAIVKQAKSLARELGVDSVLKVGIGYTTWNSSKIPVDVYIEYNSDARLVKKGDE